MSGPSIGTGRRRRIRKRAFRGDRVRRRRRTAQRGLFDGTEPLRVFFVSFGGVGSFVSRLNFRLGLRLGSFVVVRCRHDVRVVHRSLLARVPKRPRERLRRDGDVRVRRRRVFLAGRRRAVAAVAVHHLAEDDGRGRRARLGITRRRECGISLRILRAVFRVHAALLGASRGASSSSASTTSPTSSAASSSASSSASAENTDDVATSSSALFCPDGKASSAFPSASIASTRTTSAPVSIGTSAGSGSERERRERPLRSSLRSADRDAPPETYGRSSLPRGPSRRRAFETCSCWLSCARAHRSSRVCLCVGHRARGTPANEGLPWRFALVDACGTAAPSRPWRERAQSRVRRPVPRTIVRFARTRPLRTRLPRVDRHRTGTAGPQRGLERAQRHHRGDQARPQPQARLHAARDRVHLRLPFAGRAGDTPLVSAGLLDTRRARVASQVRQRRIRRVRDANSRRRLPSRRPRHELCGRWCDFDAAETLPFDPEPNGGPAGPDAPGATGRPSPSRRRSPSFDIRPVVRCSTSRHAWTPALRAKRGPVDRWQTRVIRGGRKSLRPTTRRHHAPARPQRPTSRAHPRSVRRSTRARVATFRSTAHPTGRVASRPAASAPRVRPPRPSMTCRLTVDGEVSYELSSARRAPTKSDEATSSGTRARSLRRRRRRRVGLQVVLRDHACPPWTRCRGLRTRRRKTDHPTGLASRRKIRHTPSASITPRFRATRKPPSQCRLARSGGALDPPTWMLARPATASSLAARLRFCPRSRSTTAEGSGRPEVPAVVLAGLPRTTPRLTLWRSGHSRAIAGAAKVPRGTRSGAIPIDHELFCNAWVCLDDPDAPLLLRLDADAGRSLLAACGDRPTTSRERPVPPGWFQCSLFGDDVAMSTAGSRWRSRARSNRRAASTRAPPRRPRRRRERTRSDETGNARRATTVGEAARPCSSPGCSCCWSPLWRTRAGSKGGRPRHREQLGDRESLRRRPGGAASLVLTTVILAPVLEETVFRGFLLPSLTKYMTVPWATGGEKHRRFRGARTSTTPGTPRSCSRSARWRGSPTRGRETWRTSIVVHASFNLGVLVLYALWTHS